MKEDIRNLRRSGSSSKLGFRYSSELKNASVPLKAATLSEEGCWCEVSAIIYSKRGHGGSHLLSDPVDEANALIEIQAWIASINGKIDA